METHTAALVTLLAFALTLTLAVQVSCFALLCEKTIILGHSAICNGHHRQHRRYPNDWRCLLRCQDHVRRYQYLFLFVVFCFIYIFLYGVLHT